jgi:hypothetical protein
MYKFNGVFVMFLPSNLVISIKTELQPIKPCFHSKAIIAIMQACYSTSSLLWLHLLEPFLFSIIHTVIWKWFVISNQTFSEPAHLHYQIISHSSLVWKISETSDWYYNSVPTVQRFWANYNARILLFSSHVICSLHQLELKEICFYMWKLVLFKIQLSNLVQWDDSSVLRD